MSFSQKAKQQVKIMAIQKQRKGGSKNIKIIIKKRYKQKEGSEEDLSKSVLSHDISDWLSQGSGEANLHQDTKMRKNKWKRFWSNWKRLMTMNLDPGGLLIQLIWFYFMQWPTYFTSDIRSIINIYIYNYFNSNWSRHLFLIFIFYLFK